MQKEGNSFTHFMNCSGKPIALSMLPKIDRLKGQKLLSNLLLQQPRKYCIWMVIIFKLMGKKDIVKNSPLIKQHFWDSSEKAMHTTLQFIC